MSLYGPKLRLPKVDIPNPGNPSWNLDKEKKWLVFIGIAVIIIIAAILAGPAIIQGISEWTQNALSPSLQVTWKNNPLDLKTNPVDAAELTITFVNTTKETQNISFSLINNNDEVISFCPPEAYQRLTNVSPGDTRTITCLFRRNGTIFTGTYTIDINSNLGKTSTRLEILGK